jgi:serine phosphatase RsbU (regulator of sigma subunit)
MLLLYSRQRALATELQHSMLTEPPAPAHAEMAVRYLPASHEAQVGGDWYDAYVQPDGSIVLTIGDVVGHDYRAAAAMGQLRGLLRGIGYARGRGPARCCARSTPRSRGSCLVRRPRRWSRTSRHPRRRTTVDRCLLGVMPEVTRGEVRTEVAPGDTLLLYSHGLIERRGRDLDEGLSQLQQAVGAAAGMSLAELCDHVLSRLVQSEHDDDVALVALRPRD